MAATVMKGAEHSRCQVALPSAGIHSSCIPWPSRGPPPPTDVSRVLGAMVPEDAADSAGRILFALYSSDSDEDGAASQVRVHASAVLRRLAMQ
mgnify:CR=1 FL=1